MLFRRLVTCHYNEDLQTFLLWTKRDLQWKSYSQAVLGTAGSYRNPNTQCIKAGVQRAEQISCLLKSMQTIASHLPSAFPTPHYEAVFRLLACFLPGPRRRPPTRHRVACYSSECPWGAWTPGHKPRLTSGQSCLLLSVADMSLAASGCLHRSSACMETMKLPSICQRKARKSGSTYVLWVRYLRYHKCQPEFMCWPRERQQ